MPTLKELQLQHPIGTKFRRKGWTCTGYWTFDGLSWASYAPFEEGGGFRITCPIEQGGCDDWEVYQEPKKHEMWVTFVQDKGSKTVGVFGYSTEEAAREDNSRKYFVKLACLKIEFTEGEGL